MKLYDLKRGDKFKLVDDDVRIPPSAPMPMENDTTYTYSHVDGMYAPVQGSDDERYYFAAWTEVEKI